VTPTDTERLDARRTAVGFIHHLRLGQEVALDLIQDIDLRLLFAEAIGIVAWISRMTADAMGRDAVEMLQEFLYDAALLDPDDPPGRRAAMTMVHAYLTKRPVPVRELTAEAGPTQVLFDLLGFGSELVDLFEDASPDLDGQLLLSRLALLLAREVTS
jgi:hypothetical protein